MRDTVKQNRPSSRASLSMTTTTSFITVGIACAAWIGIAIAAFV